jgi:hypothetical protein
MPLGKLPAVLVFSAPARVFESRQCNTLPSILLLGRNGKSGAIRTVSRHGTSCALALAIRRRK